MNNKEENWENSLRGGKYDDYKYKFKPNQNKILHSPQKNTESQDYNPWDFYRKLDNIERMASIIADPFKPTKNIWIDKDKTNCNNYRSKKTT